MILLKAIKTSRPLLWLPLLATLIIGIAIIGEPSLLQAKFIIPAFLFSFPYSLFVYGINDYYDTKSDNLNPRKGGEFGLKHKDSFVEHLPKLSFLGFIIPLLSLVFFNTEVIMAYLLASVLLYFYSAKPLRLKGVPLIDALVGGGMFFISAGIFGYLMYGGTIKDLFNNFPIEFLGLFILGTAMHLIGAMFDMKYDKAEGTNTSPVFFGWKVVTWFCVLISLLGVYLVRESWFYVFLLILSTFLSGLQFFEKVRKSQIFKTIITKTIIYTVFLLILTIALVDISLLK